MAINKPKVKKPKKKAAGKSLFARLETAFRMQHLFDEGVPVRYLPFGLFLMVILLTYIGNNHYAERMHRKIQKLESEVEDLRADYTTLKADYMFSSKQSEVARKVQPLGLIESQQPPVKILLHDKD
ncbi:FtsL-like putative cell division protein [Cesiribacter andamanensis]|uniref:Uncharacterized protein n=1 Tax=Cesiribacter andamanensis AMV16 TaxID=1279009 RepID=M7N4D8_9BACT|nr:FtsL-like putative cell division protein [Cesiribacter andamanensis]EMR03538.1 hypothetical protein ADICEAN_01305 [Cesiribacter andamanensis AMV16]